MSTRILYIDNNSNLKRNFHLEENEEVDIDTSRISIICDADKHQPIYDERALAVERKKRTFTMKIY